MDNGSEGIESNFVHSQECNPTSFEVNVGLVRDRRHN